ncbi:MAG: putative rane protein [Acidimicrobiales bacterium]|nr:putative rane protein [Acidimicrobiales bacterium]
MTAAATVLLVLAGACAAGDWFGVLRGNQRLRYVCKPATLAALVAVAVALHPFDARVRVWIVVGLVFSLAGDVFLMLSDRWFVAGLASFLLGHVAYVVGLTMARASAGWLLVGVAVVAVGVVAVGRPVVRSVRSGEHPELTGPVVAYLTVISAMVVSAFGTRSAWAIAGASLFYVSDAVLAWNRFVEQRRWGDIGVMTTYHLGQAGLVLFLVGG